MIGRTRRRPWYGFMACTLRLPYLIVEMKFFKVSVKVSDNISTPQPAPTHPERDVL